MERTRSIDAEVEADELRAEIARLRKALKPFAYVMDWVEQCRGHDRDAKFPTFGLTLHIDTGASAFGLTLKREDFEAAHRALNDGHT